MSGQRDGMDRPTALSDFGQLHLFIHYSPVWPVNDYLEQLVAKVAMVTWTNPQLCVPEVLNGLPPQPTHPALSTHTHTLRRAQDV